MLTIFVITIVRKELFEIRLTTQQLSFLHSNILCKIMVNDLLNNQNILKDIFEEKRGQRQKWWRREKFCTLIFFDIQISYIFQIRRVIFQKIPTTEMASFSPLETLLCHQPTPEIVLASLIVFRRVPQAEKIPDYNQVGGVFVCWGGGPANRKRHRNMWPQPRHKKRWLKHRGANAVR